MPLNSVPVLVPPGAVSDERVVELSVRRATAEAAVRAIAASPVRHLPASLLDALMGSWGTPEEVLGTRTAPVRLTVVQ